MIEDERDEEGSQQIDDQGENSEIDQVILEETTIDHHILEEIEINRHILKRSLDRRLRMWARPRM